MPRRRPLVLALAGLAAACGGPGQAPSGPANGAGGNTFNMSAPAAALERAAIDAGVVADVSKISPIGLYRHRHEAGRDSLCILPGEQEGSMRFGLEAMFGENTECHGHGTLRRTGDKLILNFARSACLIVARFEGDRIALPGALDVECSRLCSNRGTLEGVAFPRVSANASVAADARSEKGKPLCPTG